MDDCGADVRLNENDILIVRECGDRARGVGPDARQSLQSFYKVEPCSNRRRIYERLCRIPKKLRPTIIAEPLPTFQNGRERRDRKPLRRRELPDEFFIKRYHAFHLRLLEHYFRNKNFVYNFVFLASPELQHRRAPRQIMPSVFLIIRPYQTPEAQHIYFALGQRNAASGQSLVRG